MLNEFVRPQFGAKLQPDEFYTSVNTVVATLRDRATLRTICLHLNGLGLKTATGLEWNRDRLANYLQQNEIQSLNN